VRRAGAPGGSSDVLIEEAGFRTRLARDPRRARGLREGPPHGVWLEPLAIGKREPIRSANDPGRDRGLGVGCVDARQR